MNSRRRQIGALLTFVATGCSRAPEPTPTDHVVLTLAGATMGTTYSIRLVTEPDGLDGTEARVRSAVDGLLAVFNQKYSTYIPDSTIACFNATRSTDAIAVGAEFVAMVGTALRIADLTDGAYDPTVLPLVRLYGFGPESSESITAESIAAARAHIDHRKLLCVDDRWLRKSDPELEIDLSSIAKGAGVDRVSRLLAELGHPDHMVEIGGEVVCHGAKPGGEPWRIGVERPPRPGEETARPIQTVLELRDRALATSGSYRNYHESDGARLHHVLDARSGTNAPNGVVSVSVDAPTCELADGLATALMIVGPEAAPAVLAGYPDADLQVLFLIAGGTGSGVTEIRLGWRHD